LKEVDAEKHTIFMIKIKRYLDFMDTLPSDQANACYQEQFLLRLNLWFFHQISFDPFIQVHGIMLVGSFADLTMWDSTMKLPNIAPLQERKSMFLFLQNCIPLRVGGFWIFEEPFYVRWLFSIISLVMKEKFRERFHICGSDYSAFCQYLGSSSSSETLTRDRLPVCLGGTESASTIDVLEYFCRQFAQLNGV
jgi:hypothetical protein